MRFMFSKKLQKEEEEEEEEEERGREKEGCKKWKKKEGNEI